MINRGGTNTHVRSGLIPNPEHEIHDRAFDTTKENVNAMTEAKEKNCAKHGANARTTKQSALKDSHFLCIQCIRGN